MAPRTRAKTAKNTKTHRLPTQFGELDTTPTSRHLQSPEVGLGQANEESEVSARSIGPRTSTPHTQAEDPKVILDTFEDDLGDIDFLRLNESHPENAHPPSKDNITWSQVGSSRRSSPMRDEETQDAIWDFGLEESLGPFSSPRVGKDALPDTAPLPTDSILNPTRELDTQEPIETCRKVDFSETASTARRSSPFTQQDVAKDFWDLDPDACNDASINNTGVICDVEQSRIIDIGNSKPKTFTTPTEESFNQGERLGASPQRLGDTNPPTQPPKIKNIQKSQVFGGIDLTKEPSKNGQECPYRQTSKADIELADDQLRNENVSKAIGSPRTVTRAYPVEKILPPERQLQAVVPKDKKRKQRPKAVLEFDEATQRIMGRAPAKKSKPAPTRMPLVTALRNSVQPPSSPVVASATKTRAKRPPPKKKAMATKKPEEKMPAIGIPRHRAPAINAAAPSKIAPFERKLEKENEDKSSLYFKTEADKNTGELRNADAIVVSSDGTTGNDTPYYPESITSPIQKATSSSLKSTDARIPLNTVRSADPKQTPVKIEAVGSKIGNVAALAKFRAQRSNPVTRVAMELKCLNIPTVIPPENMTEKASSSGPTTAKAPAVFIPRDPTTQDKTVRDFSIYNSNRLSSPQLTARYSSPMHQSTPACDKIEGQAQRPQGTDVYGLRGVPHSETSPSRATTSKSKHSTRPSRRLCDRNFSISEKGSPVPVDAETTADASRKEATYTSIFTENLKNTPQDISHVKTSEPRHVNIREALPIVDSDMRQTADEFSTKSVSHRIQKSFVDAYRSDEAAQALPVPQMLHQAHEKSKEQHMLEAQMLAAFKDLDEDVGHLASTGQSAPECNAALGEKIYREVPNTAASFGVAQQLHSVVSLMLRHLQSKEEDLQKISDVYRRKGMKCVEKIYRRHPKEREELYSMCERHSRRFGVVVQKAKSTLADGIQRRDAAIVELQEALSERRHLYQHAISDLRLLHRQLLQKSKGK